jgi:4-hydroxy-tetrahydrodipicolinate synthase
MPAPGRFGSVVTAMVTPFNADGALDVDGAVRLARWLVAHGSDGLVLAGSTGEGTVLTDEEKAILWRTVAEAVTVPVIAGAGTADTAHSVALARAARQAGAAAILAVTPYYSRPSQAGIRGHFEAVAGATDLPVLLYDIPVRTGRRIAPATLLGLARDVPTIVGVKDATGDPAGTAEVAAQAPAGFEVYCGDDSLTLPLLAVGASGVVSVAGHWCGPLIGRMIEAFAKGDVDTARSLNAQLIPSWSYQTGESAPNPIPTKAMLRVLGLPAGQCRLPLGPAPDGLEDDARRVLKGLGAEAPTGA